MFAAVEGCKTSCPCGSTLLGSYNHTYKGEIDMCLASGKAQVKQSAGSISSSSKITQDEAKSGQQDEAKKEEATEEVLEPGFKIVDFHYTVEAYAEKVFGGVEMPQEWIDLFFELNGKQDLKAGSIVIIADPNDKNKYRLEELKNCKNKIDNSLAGLDRVTALAAYENRDKIACYLGMVDEKKLKKAMDEAWKYKDSNAKADFLLGVTKDFSTEYYSELLKKINKLNKFDNDFFANGLSREQILETRKSMLSDIDDFLAKGSLGKVLHFGPNGSMESRLNTPIFKTTAVWDSTKNAYVGVMGYADYMKKITELVKLSKFYDKLQIGLDFTFAAKSISDICTTGTVAECKKAQSTKITGVGSELGKDFLISQGAKVLCVGIGFVTGGIGNIVCTVSMAAITIAATSGRGQKVIDYVYDWIVE